MSDNALKERAADDGEAAPRNMGGGSLPELYKVYPGVVKRIQQFGAFFSILGFDKDGLIHIGQLATARVERVEDVVAEGDKLFVKVIGLGDVGDANPRIALSIKTVNQRTGEDMDPTHLVAVGDDRGKRSYDKRERPKIEIGEGGQYNTTCAKCGARGHMTKMCRVVDGAKYELLEDPEDNSAKGPSAIEAAFAKFQDAGPGTGANAIKVGDRRDSSGSSKKEHKKGKKEKKEKKHKSKDSKKHKHKHKHKHSSSSSSKRRRDDDSSSGSDSEDGGGGRRGEGASGGFDMAAYMAAGAAKLKKKHKKSKGKKKKKHRRSTSEGGSSGSSNSSSDSD